MNELSQNLRCVLLRNGIEMWVNEAQADAVAHALNDTKYFLLEGSLISPQQVAGIFTPQHMEDYKRHKEGQWKCRNNGWHDKGQKCDCASQRVVVRDGKKVKQEFTIGSGWRDK